MATMPGVTGVAIPGARKAAVLTLLLGEERLDFLCLDERDVLARFVFAGEVPVSFDSGAGDDTNSLVFGR